MHRVVMQFDLTQGPVRGPEFEQAFSVEVSGYMCLQLGFRTVRLFRSLTDPELYVEVAEWDDEQSQVAAVSRPEFVTAKGILNQVMPSFFALVAEHDGTP